MTMAIETPSVETAPFLEVCAAAAGEAPFAVGAEAPALLVSMKT